MTTHHTHHKHDHTACVSHALSEAEQLCAERGVRLTDTRKRVLELVWGSHKAAKTYDILAVLEKENSAAKPPTVYRALDFLLEQGLVHKVESLRAFVGCSHPEQKHICHFLICDECEQVTESCDNAIADAVEKRARSVGFSVRRQHLEVHGLCNECGRRQ